MIQSKKDRLPFSAKLALSAVLITNIGNGMHTLTIGKLLYDQTGSSIAFGSVFIFEYLINFIIQIFAGSLVDRHNPKKIIFITDLLRGLILLLATVLMVYWTEQSYAWIILSVFAINIGKPFFRSAAFSIGPLLTSNHLLLRYNAYYDAFQQGGQLLGISLVGLFLSLFNGIVPFAINGISYLISSLLFAYVLIPPSHFHKISTPKHWVKNIIFDWTEIFILLKSNFKLCIQIIFSGADFLSLNLLTLILVPMVAQWYGNNPYWLSVFDGATAIGSILSAGFIVGFFKVLNEKVTPALGLLGQGICFFLLSFTFNPVIVFFIIFILGVFNTFSFTFFTSTLQQNSHGSIKGRVVTVRYFFTGILSFLIIPMVTYAQAHSIKIALQFTALVFIMFGFLVFLFSLQNVFGDWKIKLNLNMDS